MIDGQFQVQEIMEKQIPREINNDNFNSFKDNLSSLSSHFEAESIELSGKEVTINNCSFNNARFTDCKIAFINKVEIKTLMIKSEDINIEYIAPNIFDSKIGLLTLFRLSSKGFGIYRSEIGKIESEDSKLTKILDSCIREINIFSLNPSKSDELFPDIGRSTTEVITAKGITIKDRDLNDMSVSGTLKLDDCIFNIDKNNDFGAFKKDYGLRIMRCDLAKLILTKCVGKLLITDSHIEKGIDCNNCELEDLAILRSTGGEISFEPIQPINFRLIQSSFAGRNSNVISSAEDAEKYYPGIFEHVPRNTPLTNKRIPKLRLTAESHDRVQLSNCYIAELDFENDAEIFSKISITDSVIGKITNLPKVFSQMVDFTGCTFLCNLKFLNVQFENVLQLQECTFKGELLFLNIGCKNNVYLSHSFFLMKTKWNGVHIDASVSFFGSMFDNDLSVLATSVGYDLKLSYIKCKDNLNFANLKITNELLNLNSIFDKSVNLNKCEIGGSYDSCNSSFLGEYICKSSKIEKNYYLSRVIFAKQCTISFVNINGQFQLKKSNLNDKIILSYIKTTGAFILDGCAFDKKISLRNNRIADWFNVGNCIFNDESNLRNIECKDLFIYNSRLENNFSIIESKISNLARIRDSEYRKHLLIQQTNINKLILFKITFSSETDVKIWNNQISDLSCSRIKFPILNFSDNIVLHNALFGADDSIFGNGRLASLFSDNCSFENTQFKGKTLFNECTFKKTAYFFNTQFEGETHFDEAQFGGDADFRTGFSKNHLTFNNAHFFGAINLDGFFSDKRISIGTAVLKDEVSSLSLTGASFDSIDFTKEQLLENHPSYTWWEKIFGLPLWQRIFTREKTRVKLFNEAMLGGYRKTDRRFVKPLFSVELGLSADPTETIDKGFEIRHKVFKNIFCNDNIGSAKDKSEFSPNREQLTKSLVDDYLVLKEAFGKSGKSHDQDWAYFRMMHFKTMAEIYNKLGSGKRNLFLKYFQLIPEFFKLFFFEYLFGWGVKLWSILRTSVLFIVLFTILFSLVGTGTSIEFDNHIITPDKQNWGIMFYLSVQAFFSVLLGDYNPQSLGPLKELVIAESIIGIFVMTFLVGAYTRKILRD